jgi:hypothetical protein
MSVSTALAVAAPNANVQVLVKRHERQEPSRGGQHLDWAGESKT